MTVDRAAELQALLEAQRHAREVEFIVAMHTNGERAAYLLGVRKHRGKEAAERIRRDAWEVMRAAA